MCSVHSLNLISLLHGSRWLGTCHHSPASSFSLLGRLLPTPIRVLAWGPRGNRVVCFVQTQVLCRQEGRSWRGGYLFSLVCCLSFSNARPLTQFYRRDLAKTQVLGIRGALHESCPTADDARRIWAEYCHRNHSHGPPVSAPPAYSPVTPSSPHAVVTPSSRPPTLIAPRTSSRIRTPPTTPTPPKFYRVAGSPRVLIGLCVIHLSYSIRH